MRKNTLLVQSYNNKIINYVNTVNIVLLLNYLSIDLFNKEYNNIAVKLDGTLCLNKNNFIIECSKYPEPVEPLLPRYLSISFTLLRTKNN